MFSLLPAVADASAQSPESSSPQADSLFAEGRRLFEAGDTREAGDVFRRAIPLLREAEDLPRLASALNALSSIHSSQGLYSQAAEAASEAARIRESLGDSPGRGDSLTNLGLALSYLGDYEASLESYRAALSLYEADGDWEGVTLLRNNIGNVLLFQGRYGEAFDEYQKALAVCQSRSQAEWSRHQRYRTVINLAALHQKIGAYDRALELYAGLNAGVLSPREEARLLSNQGALYRHLGDAVKAMESYRRAQALYRDGSDQDGELGVLKNIGIAQALDLDDLRGALSTFQQAVVVADASGNQREAVQTRLYRGETLRRLGRPDQAAGDFENALRSASELGTVEEQWKALYGLGRLAETEGGAGHASQLYQRAVQAIESVQTRLQLPSLTPGFLADKRQVYDALIGLSIDQAVSPIDPESFSRILKLIEQARSQPFVDHFAERLEEVGGNPDLGRRMRELRGRAVVLWRSQLGAAPERRKEIQAELAEIENQYLTLERQGNRGAAQSGDLPDVSSLQARIPERGMLLDYWVGDGRAALLAVGRSGLHLEALTFGEAERRALDACSHDLADPSSEQWQAACAPLSQPLLGSLESRGQDLERLWLALDRPLNSIPFEALPFQGGILLERFEISYLPGLAPLGRRSGSAGGGFAKWPWSNSLLAFGAPASAPAGAADRLEDAWPPLPFAEAEMESAAELLPGRTTVRFGATARKDEWLKSLSGDDYPVVHLATHAIADPVDPEQSRILFSPADPQRPDEFLFLGEVLNLDLDGTRLVVLSACETGRRRARALGASQDFAEAFLRAGARSVAVTLWRVSDQASANFMEGFYAFLAGGDTPAKALREAKLRFYQSGKSVRHPYFWAGFTLHGDGFSELPLPWSWRAVAIAIALLAGVLASAFLRSSKKKK